MSQTKYPMPDDIKVICINIVRGHKRRVLEYQDKRDTATRPAPVRLDALPSGSVGRPTESAEIRLEYIESHPDTKRIRAAEQAKIGIGRDLPDEQRMKLTEAIWDSCIMGRTFVLTHYRLPMGHSSFYERRREFLWDIATELGLMEVEK